MVLIAQLATARGLRAPLAHVANQVFLDLSAELNRQGVSRKVGADMFGLALRSYLRKIQRLEESSTEQGRSLWQSVLEYLQSRGATTRGEVLQRFRQDDAELVAAVLHDLTESGLVFRTGTGPSTTFRAATHEELQKLSESESEPGIDELLSAFIFREGPLTAEDLKKFARGADVDSALSRLMNAGRIRCVDQNGERVFSAERLYIEAHAAVGWEAAVFDHFQAMVKTIIRRLLAPEQGGDQVGGSTYSFEVWDGHPHQEEALQHLARFRQATSELRARIRKYNDMHGPPPETLRVTIYGGQCVVPVSEESDDI